MGKQLFMIPFAGGGDYSYNKIIPFFSREIDVIQLSLPGRGSRFSEEFLTSIEDYVVDCYNQIIRKAGENYIIMGHSMGGILCYLVGQMIIENHFTPPQKLVISSQKVPTDQREIISNLPSQEFFDRLVSYGGIPSDISLNFAIREIFEPILRNDIKALEDYLFFRQNTISVDVHLLCGNSENISNDDINSWHSYTSGKFSYDILPGGHFYLFENLSNTANILNNLFDKSL